jgi:hypothetical protein
VSTVDSTITQVRAGLPRRGSDYAELMRLVRQAGLLDRRPIFYATHITAGVVTLAAGWTAFVLLGDTWWQLVAAAFLSVAFAQNGFLTHDAGHRQIFRSRRANELVGTSAARTWSTPAPRPAPDADWAASSPATRARCFSRCCCCWPSTCTYPG